MKDHWMVGRMERSKGPSWQRPPLRIPGTKEAKHSPRTGCTRLPRGGQHDPPTYFSPRHPGYRLHCSRCDRSDNPPVLSALQDIDGRWWSCRALPLVEVDPSEGAMVICTDISKHGQAHEALRESEKRYRLTAENVTDLIWAGEIAGLKKVAERCSGYRRMAERLSSSTGLGGRA